MTFDKGQPFEIREEWPGSSALTLRLYGEFDLACRERFEAAFERLTRKEVRELVIDLAGLTFMDSTAIRTLLEAKRWADQDGLDLLVALPRDGQVRKILQLTGMDEVLSAADGT
jgi:anti-sigma B factor antagonist